MFLVIHVVLTITVSHKSVTINKLIWLISVCAGKERKKEEKNHVITAAKNNIPKAITASIIDNSYCQAVIRWLSGLKQEQAEEQAERRVGAFFFLSPHSSVLTI